MHVKPKDFKGTETEWQQFVKKKKGEDYYSKLQELENEQVTKEVKLRESSHQFAIPGEKIVNSSMAKGMAQKYQENLYVLIYLIISQKLLTQFNTLGNTDLTRKNKLQFQNFLRENKYLMLNKFN